MSCSGTGDCGVWDMQAFVEIVSNAVVWMVFRGGGVVYLWLLTAVLVMCDAGGCLGAR